MTADPVRLLVVDDHAVFRAGLRALLAQVDRIEVVAEASTTDEAVASAGATQPDVVLMDLEIPGGGGVVATERILAALPRTAVVALTMHSDERHLREVIAAGARGYLLKDAEPHAIERAVLGAAEGQLIFDRGVAETVLTGTSGPVERRPFPSLTEREHEILDRIARGLRNDAIASRIGVSTKTVQNNVSSIFLKLGARDRAQLVAMARDAGLGLGGR